MNGIRDDIPLRADRVRGILQRHRPRGWAVRKYRLAIDPENLAEADPVNKTLSVPRTTSLYSLFLYLHECAHVNLGHFDNSKPHHVEEYEAERYALHVLAAEGYTLPWSFVDNSKTVVREAIKRDRRKRILIYKPVEDWATGFSWS